MEQVQQDIEQRIDAIVLSLAEPISTAEVASRLNVADDAVLELIARRAIWHGLTVVFDGGRSAR